jgi:hypothetical protein
VPAPLDERDGAVAVVLYPKISGCQGPGRKAVPKIPVDQLNKSVYNYGKRSAFSNQLSGQKVTPRLSEIFAPSRHGGLALTDPAER